MLTITSPSLSIRANSPRASRRCCDGCRASPTCRAHFAPVVARTEAVLEDPAATPEQVESLFVAMAEVEATCARLAAMSMTPIERRRLQARHEAMMSLARAGEKILVALALLPQVCADTGIAAHHIVHMFKGSEIAGTICDAMNRFQMSLYRLY